MRGTRGIVRQRRHGVLAYALAFVALGWIGILGVMHINLQGRPIGRAREIRIGSRPMLRIPCNPPKHATEDVICSPTEKVLLKRDNASSDDQGGILEAMEEPRGSVPASRNRSPAQPWSWAPCSKREHYSLRSWSWRAVWMQLGRR